MNEQDVYDAIVTRRSTRNYKPTPVEPEKLARIIDAGRYAPSGGNSQTNRFFVVQKQEIIADIPMSELYGYSTDLRSMTGGIGDYSYEFARYEPAPSDVQAKVIDEAEKVEDDE